MADTIESFVAKLQSEGIVAGQEAADKIIADAKRQAETIIEEANQAAAKTRDLAATEADELLARSKGELKLAARDTMLRLREALQQALDNILTQAITKRLDDSDFVATTLHDLIMLYAQADIEQEQRVVVSVSPEMQAKLADWAVGEISRRAEQAGMPIELQGALSSAGFEYKVLDATVEVTPESVVQVISEIVSPKLRDLIDTVAAPDSEADQTNEQP